MVLATATALIVEYVPPSKYLLYGSALSALYAVRYWAGGYRNREARDLHNKTFILLGAFSGPGLALFHELASRGAQIIALHQDPSSPLIVQLVDLLRSTTDNERLYADECDIRSIASIHQFVKQWNKDARMGMVTDLEARIEAVVFCDGEGDGLEGVGIAVGRQSTRSASCTEDQEIHHATSSLNRFAFVQLLLPTLKRSAEHSPVRIIYSVSPFYSAGTIKPDDLSDLDYTTRTFPKWEPWRAEGSVALTSIVLMKELQHRVEESGKGRIIVMGVCGGFTRSYWRKMFRASPDHPSFSYIGLLVFLVLFPLIWLFTKSAGEASQGLVAACLGNAQQKKVILVDEQGIVESDEARESRELDERTTEDPEKPTANPIKLVGGAIYRDGRILEINLVSPESIDSKSKSLGALLWEKESKTIAALVKQAVIDDAAEEKLKEGKRKEDKGEKAE